MLPSQIMQKNRSLLISLATIAVLSSCAKVQDMHDATMEMNKTTSALADTTKDTKSLMGEIYDSGRQGAGLDLRNKLWDNALRSPKLEEKATNAGLYFVAFEFQLWSQNGLDGRSGQRERLMKDAADEFFCRLLSITHWTDVDPFAGTNPLSFTEADRERTVFNAFALTVERNNRKGEIVQGDLDGEILSMRKMIETALLAGKEIREGRATINQYPAYVDIILSHEETAVRLMQARYQMLGLTVLTQLTPIARNNVEGFKYKIWGKKWDLDFQKLNDSQIRLAKFRLAGKHRSNDAAHNLAAASLG